MKRILILYSGGADSRLLLEMALKLDLAPYCLVVDYDQLHGEELQCARSVLSEMGVPHQVVQLHGLGVDSALTGEGTKGKYEGVSEWYVPSRNLMFVSIAASVVESMGFDTIWYGADWSDNNFPDCTQEWISRVNEVLKINGSKPIRLEAPLLGLSKGAVLERLNFLGVSNDTIFSGYGDLENTSGG